MIPLLKNLINDKHVHCIVYVCINALYIYSATVFFFIITILLSLTVVRKFRLCSPLLVEGVMPRSSSKKLQSLIGRKISVIPFRYQPFSLSFHCADPLHSSSPSGPDCVSLGGERILLSSPLEDKHQPHLAAIHIHEPLINI